MYSLTEFSQKSYLCCGRYCMISMRKPLQTGLSLDLELGGQQT